MTLMTFLAVSLIFSSPQQIRRPYLPIVSKIAFDRDKFVVVQADGWPKQSSKTN